MVCRRSTFTSSCYKTLTDYLKHLFDIGIYGYSYISSSLSGFSHPSLEKVTFVPFPPKQPMLPLMGPVASSIFTGHLTGDFLTDSWAASHHCQLSLLPWATSQQLIGPVTTSICSRAEFASDAVLIHFLFLLEVIGLGPRWPPSHHTLGVLCDIQKESYLISSQDYVYGEAVQGTWFHLLIHKV